MIPLLGTFLCWGSLYVVSKLALETIPPVTVLALRYLVAIPALFLLLKVRGALRPVRREHVGTLLAIGHEDERQSDCENLLHKPFPLYSGVCPV